MKNVREYLLENTNELVDVVQELVSWNGSLDQFDVYLNDEDFFDMFFEGKPMEAVRASHYGEYNYMDEYVRFNGYGNLESLSKWDLEKEMEEDIDEIVDVLMENHHNISISEDLQELIDKEDDEEEDDE